MTIVVTINVDGVVKNITPIAEDQLALEDSLSDIGEWIVKAVEGKINNAKKRMIRAGIVALRADGQNVPGDDGDLVSAIVARPDYKNRATRDAEAK